MSERYFVATPIRGERAELIDDEARHLAGVMRAKVGDDVTLFDGSGAEFVALVTAIGRRTVELAIRERREVSRELARDFTLAVALPKGERQRWLVEKATELGVTRLTPLACERSVAQALTAALARLRRSVIEASKQCGRNRLMEIGEPVAARELFASVPKEATRLVADPSGRTLAELGPFSVGSIVAAVGPEGGFSPEELAVAREAGWTFVSLGPRILRVETAALALAAWAAQGSPTQ